MDIIQKILELQNFNQDFYDELIWFIASYEIRRGEFRRNQFVIEKVDRINFIVYLEEKNQDGDIEILYAMSAYNHIIVKEVNKKAKERGLKIIEIDTLKLE